MWRGRHLTFWLVGGLAVCKDPRRPWLATTVPPGRLVPFRPDTSEIVERIDLKGCEGAHGLMLDSAGQRAFVACESNAKMLTVDLATKSVTGIFKVGDNPDVFAVDATAQRLMLAAETGDVEWFNTAPTIPESLGRTNVHGSAHTVAVDPATKRWFFPLTDVDGHPALRIATLESPTSELGASL